MARAQPPASAAIATMVPIGPAPSTTAVSPGAILALVRGLHADREGLDHGAFGKADIVGQLEGVVGRMHHEGRQHAMHRRRRPEA